MAQAKQEKAAQTVKKKVWMPIVSKYIFEGAVLGETTIQEKQLPIGKPITVNLASITGEMKKQNINIGYRVTETKDNKAYAAPVSYSISPSLIRRVVRKGKDRVESSFLCVTKDNRVVRIKPLMITKTNTYNSLKAALIKNCHGYMANIIKKMDYYQMFDEIVTFRFHMKIKEYLNKIYPLRVFEIKKLKIEENADPSKVIVPKFREIIIKKSQPVKEKQEKPKKEKTEEVTVEEEKTEKTEEKEETK